MQSILEEITRIRQGNPITIDYCNSNRYRLIAQESDGSKTAYYFTTPIYSQKNRRMIDLQFHSEGGTVYAAGSNADITVSSNIHMENAEGCCIVEIPQQLTLISKRELCSENCRIFPTTNGIAVKANIKDSQKVSFHIEVDQPFLNVMANGKYFALMKEKFKPLVVFSCIGTLDAAGVLIAPAKIEYQKLADKKYCLTVSAASSLGQYVLYEANLYENKLFQDTTVESLNPSVNNAFGSTGFIGNTALFGEQWLYSRIDDTKITDIMNKRINSAVLHMPKFNRSDVALSAFKVSARFCSFGSNWGNRIAGDVLIADASSRSGYQSIDITPMLVNFTTRTILRSEGLILKPNVKNSGFCAIATGDSCYAPQILEINFR